VEAGDRLRTALLAAVSHDLRTPLASIKAAVSTLETPGIRLSDTDRRDLLAAIEHSTDSLRSIVDNLLDMSRLQAGALSLDLQDVGLDDVLSRAVGSVVDPAEVDIDVPPGLPDVTVDLGLLDRVVANLVQNAVRHSPAGSRTRLVAAAHGDRVHLRVVDHGPGVPDTLKPKLFEPFQRLDDRHTALGVGLGLAVAKGLTEAQGGVLRAEDTPGGGLTMVVDLPSAPAPAAAEREGA
jgi:two-component system sensor histidine kinase KdpD